MEERRRPPVVFNVVLQQVLLGRRPLPLGRYRRPVVVNAYRLASSRLSSNALKKPRQMMLLIMCIMKPL